MSGSERLLELRDRAPEFALVAFVLLAGVVAGFLGVRDAKLGGLVVAALVMLLLVSRRPIVLGIVAAAGVYFVQRVGSTSPNPGSAGGISYSDALIAAATIMALPALAATSELRRLRTAGTAITVYLALVLPSVIANHSTRVYLEWMHRAVMVGGALLVGAWLVRERAVRPALRGLTLVSCFFAVAAIANCVSHGFAPAYPFGLHKNFVGSLFAAELVLLIAGASTLRLAGWIRGVAIVVVGLGLLAAQSRGGDLAAVLGLLVAFVLNPAAHSVRVRVVAAVIAVALAFVAFLSVRDQLNQNQESLDTSSVGVRFNVEKVTRDIWRTSPIVGVGFKYYNTGGYGPFAAAANNVVDNELAESGVIGLAGFALFQFGVIMAGVRRRTSPLVPVAVGVVAGQLLHGMVDIYWSAGVITLPFLLLGIALAGSRAPAPAAATGPPLAAGAHSAD